MGEDAPMALSAGWGGSVWRECLSCGQGLVALVQGQGVMRRRSPGNEMGGEAGAVWQAFRRRPKFLPVLLEIQLVWWVLAQGGESRNKPPRG